MIPLALSSTIQFTTGPVIGAMMAFILIREKLSLSECVAASLGIIGTTLITMP